MELLGPAMICLSHCRWFQNRAVVPDG
uniref:Uncharacterized protein n=1 Tax=Rhizophora mucronata TaxID=61149 RepID=A0A2P2J9M8_RHIMU